MIFFHFTSRLPVPHRSVIVKFYLVCFVQLIKYPYFKLFVLGLLLHCIVIIKQFEETKYESRTF